MIRYKVLPVASLAACIVSAPQPASAAALENPIIDNYVEVYQITPEEAQRRLRYVEEAKALQARLQKEQPARFTAIIIEHRPSFRIVVSLTGAADELLRRYTTDPTYVAEVAPLPLVALRNRQEATAKALMGSEAMAEFHKIFYRDDASYRGW